MAELNYISLDEFFISLLFLIEEFISVGDTVNSSNPDRGGEKPHQYSLS